MNVARSAHAVTQLKHYFCIAGGFANGQWTTSAEVYDQNKDKWTQLAVMHNPRSSFAMTKANESIYAMGDAASMERYDPRENCWTMVRALRAQKREIEETQICKSVFRFRSDHSKAVNTSRAQAISVGISSLSWKMANMDESQSAEGASARLFVWENLKTNRCFEDVISCAKIRFERRKRTSYFCDNLEIVSEWRISVLVNPVCTIHKIFPFKIKHNGIFAVKCNFAYFQ